MWEKAGWDGFLLCRLNQVDPVIMGALHLTSWVQGYSGGGPSGWVLQSEHGLPELRLPSSPDPPPPIPPSPGTEDTLSQVTQLCECICHEPTPVFRSRGPVLLEHELARACVASCPHQYQMLWHSGFNPRSRTGRRQEPTPAGLYPDQTHKTAHKPTKTRDTSQQKGVMDNKKK